MFCSASGGFEEAGDDLMVNISLLFGPAAYMSGFLVASGLCYAGAWCICEQLLTEELRVPKVEVRTNRCC